MVTVLVLGGLGFAATRHLIPHLLSPDLEPAHRLSFLRIVDKVLAIPQADAYTTYVDTNCRAALKKGVEAGSVEYVQGNLLTEAMRAREQLGWRSPSNLVPTHAAQPTPSLTLHRTSTPLYPLAERDNHSISHQEKA